jgi:hypothetical protein
MVYTQAGTEQEEWQASRKNTAHTAPPITHGSIYAETAAQQQRAAYSLLTPYFPLASA